MIILSLAGHVDHGKTALVRALTGTDTDRLPEEKARGMTTDLGFAAMALDYEGRHLEIGVVDVPGREDGRAGDEGALAHQAASSAGSTATGLSPAKARAMRSRMPSRVTGRGFQ